MHIIGRLAAGLGVTALAVVIVACAHGPLAYWNAYTNIRSTDECAMGAPTGNASAAYGGRATFNVTAARGAPDVLVVLALSGGGSRAAYLSAKAMLKLQSVFLDEPGKLDLLSEVDVISSVSGGSLPAAYYAISTDPGEPQVYGRQWDEQTVDKLMTRDFTVRWFGDWFWPTNIVRYWSTGFNRTDIMAQTLADNLFDRSPGGQDLKLSDLRSSRPYLLLNATNATADHFHYPFTFTEDDFSTLNSDVGDYSLGRAVMGTATFPAVFNYMTVRDFTHCAKRREDQRFVHVFDGGNYDNLGLISVIRMLVAMKERKTLPSKVIVILIDAYTDKAGVDAEKPDPRDATDFIIDHNFVAATDSLLSDNRDKTLEGFKIFFDDQFKSSSGKQQAVFYHLQFSDIVGDQKLNDEVNSIPTTFSINPTDAGYIDAALGQLLTKDNTCLQAMKGVLTQGNNDLLDPVCQYTR
jgi:predicted acylesterase/phospholipase RssA